MPAVPEAMDLGSSVDSFNRIVVYHGDLPQVHPDNRVDWQYILSTNPHLAVPGVARSPTGYADRETTLVGMLRVMSTFDTINEDPTGRRFQAYLHHVAFAICATPNLVGQQLLQESYIGPIEREPILAHVRRLAEHVPIRVYEDPADIATDAEIEEWILAVRTSP